LQGAGEFRDVDAVEVVEDVAAHAGQMGGPGLLQAGQPDIG